MKHVALDTNSWIYLADGTEPKKFLCFLVNECREGNLEILVPKVVLDEWNRHKNNNTVTLRGKKLSDELKKTIEDIIDINKKVRFVSSKNHESELKEFSGSFEKNISREFEEAVMDNVTIIDELFKNDAIILPTKNKLYKKAGKYALQKKAPFGSKNSFADALIIFSFLDYLRSKKIKNAMFISKNHKDFCEMKNSKKELHSDLKEEFEKANCKYFIYVGAALKTINKDITNEEELRFIEELHNDYSEQSICFCSVCSESHDSVAQVFFGTFTELNDRRVLSSIKFEKIEIGDCDWCGSEHFKCVSCNTVP